MNTDTTVIDADYTPTALAVRDEPQAGIMPTVSPDEARAQMQAYQALCAAVLTDDDYQEFTEKKKVGGRYESVTKRFKKKSAVKKLQTYFGISVDVIDDSIRRDDIGDGHFGFRCKAVAKSPGGRTVAALGGCATTEERFEVRQYDDESDAKFAARQKKALARAYHDVLSTAETRATNRAVMNLVSPGEVTAEEISRPPRAPRDEPPAKPAGPGVASQEQHDEIAALAKSLGLQTRAWIAANVVPGFDREKRPLNVAEYALVKAALDKAFADEQARVSAEAQVNADLTMLPLKKAETVIVANDDRKVQPRTQGRLFALCSERLSMDADARHTFAAEHGVMVDSWSKLTEAQARTLIRALEMIPPPVAQPDPDDALAEYAEGRLL